LVQVTRRRMAAGNQRSKADEFSSSVSPEVHSAIQKVFIFLISDVAG
jgi:hypothetical protein